MSENNPEEVKVNISLIEHHERRPDPHNDNCHYKDHRKLAIFSIICGLSCFGIMSLMYSFKARETRKILQNKDSSETRQKLKKYSKAACKWGIASIIAWVVLILIFPLLVGFVSFIVTFID